MATKKNAKATPAKEAKKVMTPEEKAAKKKARLEAIKNRPAEQRQNSKTIDVIPTENGGKVLNYGHPVKVGGTYIGVLVTSVAYDSKGNVICTSTTFVPGELTIKSKKNHGNFAKPKNKKHAGEEVEEDDEDTEDED